MNVEPGDLEEKRLIALRRYGLLDTLPEAIFDGITAAIANICDVPIALISLVDHDRQWFKSAHGLQAKETPRDVAFCAHAIERPESLMVVEDAAADARFHDNPLVLTEPYIRFYAGKPIVDADGFALGTLCVIDRKPRQLLTHQLDALDALTRTVAAILEERHRLQKTAIDRDGVEEFVRDNAMQYRQCYEEAESRLVGVLEKLPSAAMILNQQGVIVSFNHAWSRYSNQVGWQKTLAGESFAHACSHASAPFDDRKTLARSGLSDVLSGSSEHYRFEYSDVAGRSILDIASLPPTEKGAIVQRFPTDPQ